MKAAVIYARYSCDNQTEQSIEGQLRVCRTYAEAHDLLIVDEYIDRAMTGTNDARPAFQKMLKDSAKQEWQVVLVYKLDRFSRNKYESTIHKKTLRDRGIAVVSATEAIPDTPEGIILESLLEGMSQYYSMELSQKVRRGQRESYLKGNYTGGVVRYGYRLENKKLYVVEKEASIIQEVFIKYAQGYTVPEIVKSLTARGIRYKDGSIFNPKFLYKLLFYSKYRGLVEHDGVVYDNIYPRIISEELWEKVQERHAHESHNFGTKKSGFYILSGKLYCAKCHQTMVGISGNGRRKKYYYYTCNHHRAQPCTCTMKPIRREAIHDVVFNTACKLVATDSMILELAKMVLDEHKKACAENYTLQALETREESTKRAISNLMNAIEMGMVNEQTKERLDVLREQLDQIQREMSVERVRTNANLDVKDVVAFLRKQFYGEEQSDEIRTAITKSFIHAVIVDEDKVIIVFNTKDEYQPTTLPQGEIQNLTVMAEKKGVVFHGDSMFVTPTNFGVIVETE